MNENHRTPTTSKGIAIDIDLRPVDAKQTQVHDYYRTVLKNAGSLAIGDEVAPTDVESWHFPLEDK